MTNPLSISLGARGNAVEELQVSLGKLGYATSPNTNSTSRCSALVRKTLF